MTFVRMEGVGKRYGLRNWVVRDVTAEVAAGRLVRLAGPNGSGKSTLLRMAARVSVPSAGKVTGRLPTGYVPERFPPALPLTARDYLRHLGRVHGLRGRMLAAGIDECLERLGAAADAGLAMRGMSKGMCQKVAVAQALLAPPGLLVLDEAWTGLDQAARDALDAAVAERLAGGGRVMFVDHDQRRLAGLVSDTWQVLDGRVTVVRGGGAGTGTERGSAVVIELSGTGPGLAAAAGRLPGVLSVRAAGEHLVITAGPGASDAVLRMVLAGDAAAHVVAVRQETGAQP